MLHHESCLLYCTRLSLPAGCIYGDEKIIRACGVLCIRIGDYFVIISTDAWYMTRSLILENMPSTPAVVVSLFRDRLLDSWIVVARTGFFGGCMVFF